MQDLVQVIKDNLKNGDLTPPTGVSLASHRFSETLKGSRRLRKKIGEIQNQLDL